MAPLLSFQVANSGYSRPEKGAQARKFMAEVDFKTHSFPLQ